MQLPLLLNLVAGLLLEHSTWALGAGAIALVVVVVVVALLLRRRPLVLEATTEGLSVPTWRHRREVAWADVVQVRGELDRWDSQQVLELTNDSTVDLPVGCPRELVEQWRAELAERPVSGEQDGI